MSASATLQHSFTPLRHITEDEIRWIVCFYRPIHSDGSRRRLNRLEAQATLTRAIATSVAARLHQSKHEYFRLQCEVAKERIKRSVQKLLDCSKIPDESSFQRIGNMFLLKRHLLNIILFVHENDPEVTKPRWNAIKLVEDLVEDDTNEWMEILDYIQTMKNPHYLN